MKKNTQLIQPYRLPLPTQKRKRVKRKEYTEEHGQYGNIVRRSKRMLKRGKKGIRLSILAACILVSESFFDRPLLIFTRHRACINACGAGASTSLLPYRWFSCNFIHRCGSRISRRRRICGPINSGSRRRRCGRRHRYSLRMRWWRCGRR